MSQLPVYQLPCNIETAELYKETNQHLAPAEALLLLMVSTSAASISRVQIAVEAGSWLPLEIIIFIVRPQSIITTISESALLLGAAAGNGALWASDNCTNSAYRGSGFVVCSCIFRIVRILSFPLLIRWHRFHFRKIPSAECRINFDKQA